MEETDSGKIVGEKMKGYNIEFRPKFDQKGHLFYN